MGQSLLGSYQCGPTMLFGGRWNRFIEAARTTAEASNCYSRKRMSALVIKGGKILAAAPNKKNHRGSIHAEANAMARMARQKRKPKGCMVLVARFRQDGSFGNAKPCANCLEFMRAHQIRQVAWTTNAQTIEILPLDLVASEYVPPKTQESDEAANT